MSSDRQRLVSAIQRIARTDPDIRSAIDATNSRGSQPASTGVGASDTEGDRQCCDGSVSGNTNPGSTTRDPDAEGVGQDGGLDSDDPARLDMGQGVLSGVTDCETGDPICFAGSDWLPPEGWGSPTAPPSDPEYIEGIYYHITDCGGLGGVFAPTERLVLDEFAGKNGHDECSWNGTAISCGSTSYLGCTVGQDDCAPGSTADYCNPDPEDLWMEDEWPADSCINLAIKGGKIVGSKFDPENDGSYSSPKSEIELCDGAGNKIKLAPSANGGWKTVDAINGGDGYLYDSQGQQIARISGDEYSDPRV